MTAEQLISFARGAPSLDIVDVEGLKAAAVRAFDATVVIVSLTVPGEGRGQRLVGSYLTDSDFARGAALAVLHATNRILGNKFFMR